MMPSTGSAPGGSVSVSSSTVAPSTVSRNAPRPDAADEVGAGIGRAQSGPQLDRGDLADGHAGDVRAEPGVRGAVALLVGDGRAVGGQEGQRRAGPPVGAADQLGGRGRQPAGAAPAAGVDDLDVAERGAQARPAARRCAAGTPSRCRRRACGRRRVRAQHGDPAQPARVEREHGRLVAGQHEAGRGGRAQLRRDLVVGRRCGRRGRPTPSSAPTRPASRRIRRTLSSTTASSTVPALTAATSSSPHGPSGPGISRSRPRRGGGQRAAGVPVGHRDAVEAPFLLEDVAQQRRLGHRVPVDAVVGGHHRPHPALADDRLERRQVELAQGPLVDRGVVGEPLGLRVVGHEVLDGGADAERPGARARMPRRAGR